MNWIDWFAHIILFGLFGMMVWFLFYTLLAFVLTIIVRWLNPISENKKK